MDQLGIIYRPRHYKSESEEEPQQQKDIDYCFIPQKSNGGKSNDSVSAEETISKKRVDYGFRISGIPKFFVEAKSIK